VFITKEKNARHSAIIYGGRPVTNDRFSALARLAAFNDICGADFSSDESFLFWRRS
jgi:hypothetical protein